MVALRSHTLSVTDLYRNIFRHDSKGKAYTTPTVSSWHRAMFFSPT